MTSPLKVVISYSHNAKDVALLDQLLLQLKPLVRTGKITIWEDRQIAAGENWQEITKENLLQADIALLLVSADYIASEYESESIVPLIMDRKKEGACRVLPILLRACYYQFEPYAKDDFLPVLPENGQVTPVERWPNPNEAFDQIFLRLLDWSEGTAPVLESLDREPADRSPGFGVTQQKKQLPDGEKYFFGIGINRYQHWKPLYNAVNDMKSLAALLQQRYGYKSDKMVLLEDAAATRSAIINQLHTYTRAGALGEHDSLLIYYSGHGYLDDDNNNGYWAPVEAPNVREDISGMIPNSTIRDSIQSMKCRHVLLISDSCFSGSLLHRSSEASLSGLRNARERAQRKSRRILCSSSKDEKASDGRLRHSPFAEALISELTHNEKPLLMVDDIFNDVCEATLANSRQTPHYDPLSDAGDLGGRLVFTLQGADTHLDTEAPEAQQPATLETTGQVRQQPSSVAISNPGPSDLERQGWAKELELAIQKLQALRNAVLLENNASVKFGYHYEIENLESRINQLKSKLSI